MRRLSLRGTWRWGQAHVPLFGAGLACVLTSPVTAQRPQSKQPPRPATSTAQATTTRAPMPNIVLLVADDLGYHDLGVQGMRDIPTPNIDRLAKEGVRFTDAYMVSPLCSPSRAGILTGRYPERWGQELNPGRTVPSDSSFGIPREYPLLAERLKALGYATAIFGKWHLGYLPQFLPTSRGFDEFYGFLGPAHPYRRSLFAFLRGGESDLMRGTRREREKEFLTDAFTREATRFIDAHPRQPFFLYVPFNAVHEPIVEDDKRSDRVESIENRKRREYASVLIGLDDAVGRIVGALDRIGATKSTLVIFLSDNGGPTPNTTSRNTPLRGLKATMLEGGIRVPFLMRWPGRIPAGRTYTQPVSAMDVAPTALAATGRVAPGSELDGVDLVPFLTDTGKGNAPHGPLFWRMAELWAVREGRWKLVSLAPGDTSLYDLQEDIGEARDVARAHPDVVERLAGLYRDWAGQMQPPRWGVENWKRRRGEEH